MREDSDRRFAEAFAMLSPEDQAQAESDRQVFGKCVITVVDGKATLETPWHYITGEEIVERRKALFDDVSRETK